MQIKQLKSTLVDILQIYSPTPFIDADYIITKVFDLSKSNLYSLTTIIPTDKQLEVFNKITLQLKEQKPLAYIFGEKEFYGLNYRVSRAVLIPRPETELIVELALKFINLSTKPNLKMIDLGTGSGCIPISILANTKIKLDTIGLDISKSAVDIANSNKNTLLSQEKRENINFINTDMFDFETNGMFDIITSNPPYIPQSEIKSLDANVKNFEPQIALDGGIDGLDYYKRLVDVLDKYLKDDGVALLELHSMLANEIKGLFASFNNKLYNDLAGLPRTIAVSKSIEQLSSL